MQSLLLCFNGFIISGLVSLYIFCSNEKRRNLAIVYWREHWKTFHCDGLFLLKLEQYWNGVVLVNKLSRNFLKYIFEFIEQRETCTPGYGAQTAHIQSWAQETILMSAHFKNKQNNFKETNIQSVIVFYRKCVHNNNIRFLSSIVWKWGTKKALKRGNGYKVILNDFNALAATDFKWFNILVFKRTKL